MPLEVEQAVGNVPRKGQPATVGRNLGYRAATRGEPPRCGATAFARGDVHRLTGLELEPAELNGAVDEFLVVRRHGDLVVQILPVTRDAGPRRRAISARPAAAACANERDALAAILVIHPKSASRPGANFTTATPALANDDVIAVRRPRRFDRSGIEVTEHRMRIRSVGVHDPEVVLAAAVGDEGDLLAVRRDARLEVQRHARVLREHRGFAARGRHAIHMTE